MVFQFGNEKNVICQTYYLRKNTILHTSNIYIRNQRKPEETVSAEVIHDQDNDQRIYIQLELLT